MPRGVVIDIEDRIPPRGARSLGWGVWVALLVVVLLSGRTIARFIIDFEWWREMGQVDTWERLLLYTHAPAWIAGVLAFPVLWLLLFEARREARQRMKLWVTGLALALAVLVSLVLVDNWTVVRWWASRDSAAGNGWADPLFGQGLGFYFFQLPFFEMSLGWLRSLLFVGLLSYWVVRNVSRLRGYFEELQHSASLDFAQLGFRNLLDGWSVRIAGALFFLLTAASYYLDRYDLLREDHGFLTGADYVAVNYQLPLIWLSVGAALVAAGLILSRRAIAAIVLVIGANFAAGVIPRAVNTISVRPNEISLQKPFIGQHIQATREAYGLQKQLKERDFPTQANSIFDPEKHKELLANVRLWDWKAFHDTLTQIQALRPYYEFKDTDVDRYRMEDGKIHQVMLSPRELDVQKLPDARSRWINPHFIYTHGYGLVMAESNKIASDGLPDLLLRNAPLEQLKGAPQVNRPEIYFGEAVHEPVFVRTMQPEFNYPSGNENVHTKYDGKGGIPVDTLPKRFAAALAEGDWNILLTNYLTADSRMLIRRNITQRVDTLAEFLAWDVDPYMVVTKAGRLVWMIDGFTISSRHPYSRPVNTAYGRLNYIRNSVKATVDAYDGTVTLYVWDENDPILKTYAKLFPGLFRPGQEMPADLRAHTRYPEALFSIQAEIYRTYHMKDPESFYNKEDLWDIAQTGNSLEGQAEQAKPTYVMATLPGDKSPEFILLTTFTPRTKQNLIGLMAARCDGTRLGEIEVLQLSKQQLVFGPLQISARINQDQQISKDLTLWNQQGSSVIKGQMLVLPMDDQFLYVEPIYIQASRAPMPELRKVALANGSSIGYGDTYAEALSILAGKQVVVEEAARRVEAAAGKPSLPSTVSASSSGSPDPRIERLRTRLKKYRELMGAGRFVDAARELEAMENDLK